MKPLLTVKLVADLLHLSRGTVARLVDTENLSPGSPAQKMRHAAIVTGDTPSED